MRSTIRGKSRWPYFATRTSVSKSTSVMSFASLSVLRNLIAADRDSLMSSVMLALVSNSSPTCISGPFSMSVPRAKYFSVCFWPSSRISKSSAFRSLRYSPFLSTTVTPKDARSMPVRNVGVWAVSDAAPTAMIAVKRKTRARVRIGPSDPTPVRNPCTP